MVCQIVEEVIHDSAGNRVAYTSEEETKAKKSRSGERTPRAPRTPKKKETTEPKYKYTVASLPQVCPVCGVGRIVRGRTAYGCTNYANGCTFRISFDEVKPE